MPAITTGKVYEDEKTKLGTYKHRLDSSDKDFRNWEQEAKKLWARYRLEKEESQLAPNGHRAVPSIGVGTIDSLFASLTATQVDFVVKPKGFGTPQQAKLAEHGINEVWEEQKGGRKAERAVKDALISDIGFVKVSYEYQERVAERARSDEDIAADVDAIIDDATSRGAAIPTPDEMASVVATTEKFTEVVRDHIVLDYVPWDELRWDTTARAWEDLRWVAQVTKLPVDEVTQNPTYRDFVETRYGRRKLKTLDDLRPDHTARREAQRKAGMPEDPDDDRISVVEMYDFHAGTKCVFPRWGDFLLFEGPNPFAVNDDLEDKNPYVALVVRDSGIMVQGVSDMRLMSPTLDELTEYRSNLATYIARTIPKILGREGVLTEAGKAALESLEWGAFVELTDDANAVAPLVPPQLPQEVFNVPAKLEEEIREATGASEVQRGLFPDSKQTATTTLQVAEAGNIRQSEKRNRMERFYIDIARRILMLMQLFYDRERIARVVELEGDIEWEWTAEDVTMEADLRVFLSPKELVTAQSRRDNAIAWVNLLAPIPGVDLEQLIVWGMEESGLDLATIRRFFKTEEQKQKEAQEALQLQAQQQAVAEGEAPDPAAVPGPMTGEETAAAANQGEVPPEVAAALAFSRERPVVPQGFTG